MRIAVVEDDQGMLDATVSGLRRHGFEVLTAGTGEQGFHLARSVDLMLLDLGLPDVDGLEVCRRVRQVSDVPIIVVTARGDEQDLVRGLEVGADDYVVKPYSMRELVARVRANARRYVVRGDALQFGPIRLDREHHSVTCDGEELKLTPKEFELLSVLLEEPGRVVPRQELHSRIWDPVWVGSGKSLDVHVTSLRRKLAPAKVSIEAIRGVGFRVKSD